MRNGAEEVFDLTRAGSIPISFGSDGITYVKDRHPQCLFLYTNTNDQGLFLFLSSKPSVFFKC